MVTEDCLRLDISTLNRLDCFEQGCLHRRQIKWDINGHRVASAEIDVILFPREPPRAVIKMRGLPPQTIRLTYTRPNYGGRRWWFVCPSGRRCRTLYLPYGGTSFVSIKAGKLSYHSSSLAPGDRVRWQAKKARGQLPGAYHDHYPPRPKGMHVTTYNRIVAELREYDEQINEQWLSAAGKYADKTRLASAA